MDEFMTQFKGHSSMRQYLKMKSIKRDFKWWFRCASSNGYFNEFDVLLGKIQNVEVNLSEGVVMQFSEKLKGTFYTLLFDNFFHIPLLINKLFEENIYAIVTVRSYRKHIRKLQDERKMVRGYSEVPFSKNVICCKWFDNKPVLLLATNIEGMEGTSNEQCQPALTESTNSA